MTNQGKLCRLPAGGWAIVAPGLSPVSIVEGEVFELEVAGRMKLARMERRCRPDGTDEWVTAQGTRRPARLVLRWGEIIHKTPHGVRNCAIRYDALKAPDPQDWLDLDEQGAHRPGHRVPPATPGQVQCTVAAIRLSRRRASCLAPTKSMIHPAISATSKADAISASHRRAARGALSRGMVCLPTMPPHRVRCLCLPGLPRILARPLLARV